MWQVLEERNISGKHEWYLKCPNCDVPAFWCDDSPEKTHHRCFKVKIEPPKLPTKALNVTKALFKYAALILRAKKPYITKEQYQARLDICDKCVHRSDEGVCLSCGCGIKGKIFGKAILASEKCPLNKWAILYDRSILESHARTDNI